MACILQLCTPLVMTTRRKGTDRKKLPLQRKTDGRRQPTEGAPAHRQRPATITKIEYVCNCGALRTVTMRLRSTPEEGALATSIGKCMQSGMTRQSGVTIIESIPFGKSSMLSMFCDTKKNNGKNVDLLLLSVNRSSGD